MFEDIWNKVFCVLFLTLQ